MSYIETNRERSYFLTIFILYAKFVNPCFLNIQARTHCDKWCSLYLCNILYQCVCVYEDMYVDIGDTAYQILGAILDGEVLENTYIDLSIII